MFWRLPAILVLVLCTSVAAAHDPELQGRVENELKEPVHEAELELLLPGTGKSIGRTITDHAGRFHFSGLPGRDLEIIVRKQGLEPLTIFIPASELHRELIITLPAAAQVRTEIAVFGSIPREAASTTLLKGDELAARVIEDPGDVLRAVPGLVVAQHAGGRQVRSVSHPRL